MITYRYLSDGTKISAEAVLQPEIDEGDGIIPATQGVICTMGTELYGSEHDNRYRYAGKEEQDIAGMDLGLLDFGARFYDPFTCRWNAVDPLAHKYFGLSPYNYCGNDPVNRFDPDGMTDYFDFEGNFLWNDGLDNAKIKITTQDEISKLQLSLAEITDDKKKTNEIKKFCNSTSYFHDKIGTMSNEAIIKVYNHYNDSGLDLFYDPELIKNNDTKNYNFCYEKDKEKIGANIELNREAQMLNYNSYNIYSSISVHERQHDIDKKSKIKYTRAQLELRAIDAQMGHPSWSKTSPMYKEAMNQYRSKWIAK